jgi:hypothetical protein
VKKSQSSRASNLTSKYEIIKKKIHKKKKTEGKKYEATMINLTNLLSEI